MAMGKATIVSATTGLAGIVEEGETGRLVPPGNPVALTAAIRSLLADPGERARLGRNARRAAERFFSLDTYVDRLAEELEAVSTRDNREG
jgi:colanic acid/amylovoran biosynthesis glycosyltransferase